MQREEWRGPGVIDLSQFHLAACCDASLSADTCEARIGVSVVLVNHGDLTDERPLLYAWTKERAQHPSDAERTAIRFAYICLDRSDIMERMRAVCPEQGTLKTASLLNDCQTVVDAFVRSRDLGYVQEIFRSRYTCDLNIEWESNQKHSRSSCMALVDRMANAARTSLKLYEEVFCL